MANASERHEQLMQQMAALTASLGGLFNLNPLLAQQQQTNAELSSLSTHLGGVAARIDALVAAGGGPPPGRGDGFAFFCCVRTGQKVVMPSLRLVSNHAGLPLADVEAASRG